MLSLSVDFTRSSVRRSRGASRKARETVARALASLCEVCGGALGGGAVLFGPTSYCSVECAHSARHRFVAGNYLG
ncbi:MAG TPA: hypothetical protein VFL29_02205 [Candidatus Dormibacteraeota bacterium]|nr:hypothetical protein [Candidatus Dormibacteraeota bacterium]